MSIIKVAAGTGAAIGLVYGIFAASQNISMDQHQKEVMAEASIILSNFMKELLVIGLKTMGGSVGFSLGAAIVEDILSKCSKKELANQKQMV